MDRGGLAESLACPRFIWAAALQGSNRPPEGMAPTLRVPGGKPGGQDNTVDAIAYVRIAKGGDAPIVRAAFWLHPGIRTQASEDAVRPDVRPPPCHAFKGIPIRKPTAFKPEKVPQHAARAGHAGPMRAGRLDHMPCQPGKRAEQGGKRKDKISEIHIARKIKGGKYHV